MHDLVAEATEHSTFGCESTATADGDVVGGCAIFGCPLSTFEAQADLAIFGVHAENLDFDLLTEFDDFLGIDFFIRQLADVQQPFEVLFEFHKHAEVGDLGDLAVDDLAGEIVLGNLAQPGVFGELLEAEGHAHLLFVDREDHALKLFALFEQFRRVADFARPAQVAHMQQTVDAFFDFHKRAEVGHVADRARDDGSGGVLFFDDGPRVHFRLLHAERNFLLVFVDVEDNHVDFVGDGDQFVGVVDAACPGHLGDVDEAFQPFFELDERTIAGDVDNRALDAFAHGVFAGDVVPGAFGFLLETERDFFFFVVDRQDHDFDLVVDLHQLGRVVDPAPAHVGDV